jgi:hypothetical protein
METSKPKKASVTRESTGSKKVTEGKNIPGEHEIRAKAKEIYLERIASGKHGTAEDDWLKAEELLKRSKK